MTEPEADAERLYYLEDCARRAGNDAGIQSAVEQLGQRYPKSTWRLKALASAASRFLLVNQPDAYLPLYRAAYEDFPDAPAAGLYHWKVAFHAYMHGDRDAEDLLREHLARYPGHATAAASLYFLSRHAERQGEYGAARAWYRRLTGAFPNTYYGMLARERLRTPEVASAGSAPGGGAVRGGHSVSHSRRPFRPRPTAPPPSGSTAPAFSVRPDSATWPIRSCASAPATAGSRCCSAWRWR